MKKGEITRQRIVALAAPIFNRNGYSGCSMQDVMEATGLEKGGLYRHFSSKEELAAEAFRYALKTAVKVRTEGLEAVDSPLEKIRLYIRRFVELPSPLPGGCPLLNTAVDSDDGNPLLRKLAFDGFAAWKARICVLVEDGIRRGEIRKSVAPLQIANTIIATLEGSLLLGRLEGSRVPMHDAQSSLDLLLNVIATRPGTRPRRVPRTQTADSGRVSTARRSPRTIRK
ncbi:MAG TPA: TetR/AcrR family transcriptional regulator [Terracidiphilus sp.]|jgi:TetR/AcrR family transcriptional repressor of nem operon|nr:TetR/AcrR family transcriptional regulator [Terracidiphilus sp.]